MEIKQKIIRSAGSFVTLSEHGDTIDIIHDINTRTTFSEVYDGVLHRWSVTGLTLLKSAKGKPWSKKKSQTHKRLIPDSCWSVGVEQGGGDGLQTMALTSSSNPSLRDREEVTVIFCVSLWHNYF